MTPATWPDPSSNCEDQAPVGPDPIGASPYSKIMAKRSHVVELDFAIGDRVSFGDPTTPYEGTVRAIEIREEGKSYQMGYWRDGSYSLIWLIPPEIQMIQARVLPDAITENPAK